MDDPSKPGNELPSGPEQGLLSTQLEIDTIMCIKRAVAVTFLKMCNLKLPPPQIHKKPIIKWQGRMRLIKPLDTAFTSVITFRLSESKSNRYEVLGIAGLYVSEDVLSLLLQSLGLRGLTDEEDLKDGLGEFLNVICGAFKAELVKEGYPELNISTPYNFSRAIDELFDYYKDEKFEMLFPIPPDNEMHFYLDLALTSVDKLQNRPSA